MNMIVLDLETLYSADDCRSCHCHKSDFETLACTNMRGHETIGWNAHALLGLSIGCWYDYSDDQYHYFDPYILEPMMRMFVERQPLMISFNGVQFDFSLMRALLRHRPKINTDRHLELMALCDAFKTLATGSYDLLREIWQVDPENKFQKGNGLDAISQANGYGAKAMDGATAPVLWRQGRYAQVIDYCTADVWKTRKLFEKVLRGEPIERLAGAVVLPLPLLDAIAHTP